MKTANCEKLPFGNSSNFHALNMGKDHTGHHQIKMTSYEDIKYNLIVFLDCRQISEKSP